MEIKVLLIDDETDIIEFQKHYLGRRKYKVITASGTQEAIEAIKNNSPDVAFCDVKLETETSGFESRKSKKPSLENRDSDHFSEINGSCPYFPIFRKAYFRRPTQIIVS